MSEARSPVPTALVATLVAAIAACALVVAAPAGAQRAQTFGADSTAAAEPAAPDTAAVPSAPSAPPATSTRLPTGPAVVRSVRAAGFTNVDTTVILRTFAIKPGEAYDPVGVRAGVRRLFATGLFTDVDVRDAQTPQGVDLTIAVRERARVQSVAFNGAKKIDESTLKGKITVAAGQLLDAGTLELDARKIQDAYAEEGYSRARVSSITRPAGPGAVIVTFHVEEGPKLKVRGITVLGARTLSPEGLRKSMKSKTPALLRSGTFKPSQIEED